MLIGRERERDVLGRALAALPQRQGSAVFLAGEAGIGKSTLLNAFRGEAIHQGCAVAFDVGSQAGWSVPYAVWASLLTQLGQPADLALRSGANLSADEHRLRVHRDVIAAIRDVAKLRPVVLSLDDVQWMDQLSRSLLLQAIRDLGQSSVVIVGSWRTPIPEQEVAIWADLTTMSREPGVQWLELAGLEAADTTALIAQHGLEASAAVVGEVMRRTQGNPFFVVEIARALAGSHSELLTDHVQQVPTTVRQMVRQRFLSLNEPTRQLLGVASIFPRGVDFATLGDITDIEEDTLLVALDEALDRAILRPSERRAEHYRFANEMVREAMAASWSDSRRARLHRRAAEVTERQFTGRSDLVAGDLALHFAASRSLPGAEVGIPYALRSAELAAASFDFAQAAAMLTTAQQLAETAPLATQADIAWRRALALADAVQVTAAERASEEAVRLLAETGADADTHSDVCWRLAGALNAIGASTSVRDRVRDAGLQVLGSRRDLAWARLRLLSDAMEVVPHDVLYVARWRGYDPEAQGLARQQGTEDDGVQTIESFDPRTPRETRGLLALARSWQQPRSTLRGLTAVGNDLTYRHGEFRLAMTVWKEAFDLAQRIGAVPWQANAINQITLLHVTLGEFAQAVTSSHEADAVNARLGPANDAEALHMERDFALSHVLDGDWPGQAAYWLGFAGNPPHGLEARLAVPLYAAMAASASAIAGVNAPKALRLVDALIDIADIPGIQQLNGVVGWAADAVFRLQASDRASALDRLAADLIEAGVGDYPQTSLWLTRARMLTLLGDSNASRAFDMARETLLGSGQVPLHGIACFEQAIAPTTSIRDRQRLLTDAKIVFERLGMTSWLERVTAASEAPVRNHPDLAGLSARELEVLRLVTQGYSDRRVADSLFISERTVNAHVRNILRKTDTANRTELASWAQNRRILDSITATS